MQPRPGSRRRSSKKANFALPLAKPSQAFQGLQVPSNSNDGPAKLYIVNQADYPTYVAMVKSDIYQVQRRLEKVQRKLDSMMGVRPLSSRGRDIKAITEATSEVEQIVKASKKGSQCKLRLMELLNTKMVQLETVVLRLADGSHVFKNVAGNYGTPSMSRLPAFLEIVDQVLSLQRMVGRFSTKLDSELDAEEEKESNGPLPKALNELESQVQIILSSLNVKMQNISDSTSPASRITAVAAALVSADKKGVRPMKARTVKADATVTRLREETAGLHARLEKALEKVAKANDDASAAHEAAKSAKAAAAIGAGKANGEGGDVQELRKQLEGLSSELERLRTTKGSAEDAKAAAVDAVKADMSGQLAMLKSELKQKSTELAKTREALATSVQAHEEAKHDAETARNRVKLNEKKAETNIERLRSNADSLGAQVKVLEDKNKAFEKTIAGEGTEGTGGLDEALKRELEATKAELEKRQKSLDGLDMYMKDMSEKKDLELEQYRQNVTKLKNDFKKEREQWRGQDEIKAKHVEKLKAVVERHEAANQEDDDDSFEEILREEMRVMKASFELKMSELRQELAQKSIACSRETRLLKEELETERRQCTAYASKLKALETKKQ